MRALVFPRNFSSVNKQALATLIPTYPSSTNQILANRIAENLQQQAEHHRLREISNAHQSLLEASMPRQHAPPNLSKLVLLGELSRQLGAVSMPSTSTTTTQQQQVTTGIARTYPGTAGLVLSVPDQSLLQNFLPYRDGRTGR